MILAAEQAGHLQVHMVVHKFHPQLRSAAGAFDMGRGGSQGKQVPLHNDRLTAGGADAALAASLFHYKELEIMDLKAYLAERGIPMRM